MITKLPKLVIGFSKKYKGVKKLKSFKPKPEAAIRPLTYSAKDKAIFSNTKFHLSTSASIARQDKASRVASHIEHRSLREGLRRIRAKSLSIFGTKGHYEKVPGTNFKRISAKGKRAKAAFIKAGEKVTLISKRKGLKVYDKASTKLGVSQRRFSARKRQTAFTSDYERKITGMPPVEYTADMKSFHGVRPAEMVRRHRASLSKIYSKPKSWRKRKDLITHYRTAAKTELKQAKMDRNIFRDESVQQITGWKELTTKGGYVSPRRKVIRPITKTIRSPELKQDIRTKRWYRTKLFD